MVTSNTTLDHKLYFAWHHLPAYTVANFFLLSRTMVKNSPRKTSENFLTRYTNRARKRNIEFHNYFSFRTWEHNKMTTFYFIHYTKHILGKWEAWQKFWNSLQNFINDCFFRRKKHYFQRDYESRFHRAIMIIHICKYKYDV